MVSLKFHDCIEPKDFVEVRASIPSKDICIHITEVELNIESSIYLDRATAIKLSKELRKQIALIPY